MPIVVDQLNEAARPLDQHVFRVLHQHRKEGLSADELRGELPDVVLRSLPDGDATRTVWCVYAVNRLVANGWARFAYVDHEYYYYATPSQMIDVGGTTVVYGFRGDPAAEPRLFDVWVFGDGRTADQNLTLWTQNGAAVGADYMIKNHREILNAILANEAGKK